MKKFLGTVSLSVFLLTNAVLPVMAQTATGTATTTATSTKERGGASVCMQAATAKKKAALATAKNTYTAAIKATKDARKTALEAAKNLTDRTASRTAKRAANDARKTALENARKANKDAKKSVKSVFEADRNVCLEALRKENEAKKEEKRKEVEERKDERKDEGKPEAAKRASVTVSLSAQNNSGENGVATLKEDVGKVMVRVNLGGAPRDVKQPAHIHMGSCATLGAVKYPLTSLDKGKSETTLNVTLAQLKSELPLAVNVHKSDAEANVYVACGDLKL